MNTKHVIMQRQSVCTVISPERVAEIERYLDDADTRALIFLLYDEVEVALQNIIVQIQSMKKYQPVLDSALYRNGQACHEGALARWARSCVNVDDYWQDKLLEALLIIKNYRVIKALGRRKENLELQFLPSQPHTACYVDLVRKCLFLMMDNMSTNEWDLLQNILSADAKSHGVPVNAEYSSYPEYFILFLMSRKLLKIKKGEEKMDFQLLRNCMKRMELSNLDDWSDLLESLEKVGNEEVRAQTEKAVGRFSRGELYDLPRFNLDTENPGTLLIINLQHYNEKSQIINGKPLSERKGSNVDCERLRDTFRILGFTVPPPVNDPFSETIIQTIKSSLREFCLETKRSKRERCFVVAILGHGQKDGVFPIEGELITWDDIRATLRSSDTVGLPRLLLIQACKGASQVSKANSGNLVVEDGPASSEAHSGNLRDLFELSASVSGFAAYRSEMFGSFFIHSFCKNILLDGHHMNLHDIAAAINRDFDEKPLLYQQKHVFMTSELQVTATKTLFLGTPENKHEEAKELVRKWEKIETSKGSDSPSYHCSKLHKTDRDNKMPYQECSDEMLKILKDRVLQINKGCEK